MTATPHGRARRTSWKALIAMTALTGFAAVLAQPGDSVPLDMARDALEAGAAVLIDIREPQEHARGVAQGARLLPLSQVRQRLGEIPTDPAQPVLLICNTQNRSATLLRALREHGYAHVRYVQGGMSGWVQRGWPVVLPAPNTR